jgi:hypothetical protein
MIYMDINLTPLFWLASAVLMTLAALGAGITGYWWGALIPWPALEFFTRYSTTACSPFRVALGTSGAGAWREVGW